MDGELLNAKAEEYIFAHLVRLGRSMDLQAHNGGARQAEPKTLWSPFIAFSSSHSIVPIGCR